MTLQEAIRTVYRPPVQYQLAGTDKVVTFTKPTQLDLGDLLAALAEELPEATSCIDLMREDVRLRENDAEAETPWSKLDPSDRAAKQRSLVRFESELNQRRAMLCLRHDPDAIELDAEDIRYLVENDTGFMDCVSKLCGEDADDPTGSNDNPFT